MGLFVPMTPSQEHIYSLRHHYIPPPFPPSYPPSSSFSLSPFTALLFVLTFFFIAHNVIESINLPLTTGSPSATQSVNVFRKRCHLIPLECMQTSSLYLFGILCGLSVRMVNSPESTKQICGRDASRVNNAARQI